MGEIWKDIRGYEGLYQVSNYGRVKSLPRTITNLGTKGGLYHIKGRILKPQVNRNRHNYCEVNLYKGAKSKRHKIHRLVAETFIDNPDCKLEVNHKDGDKANNYVENLEWVTDQENKTHAWSNGLMTANHRKEMVICNENGQVYESITSAAKSLGIHTAQIHQVLRGERKNVNGFSFKRV